jgi:hypothetical protein
VRRGRPPLTAGERGVSLSTTLPAAVYDALVAQATAERLPLASYTRVWLTAVATGFATEKSTRSARRGVIP